MHFLRKLIFALSSRERLAFLVSSGIAIMSFIVVMSMLIAQATTAVPVAGGTYTEGMVGQPEYINPVIATSQADISLVKLVYSNLSDIADRIDVTPDGKTWTVHLKNNLTWQDGQKVTSDDVIFTIQSIQNPDAKSPLATSWQGVVTNRVSELELTFTLGTSYAFFKDNLTNLYIAPKHIFADVPPGNWRLADYNLKPIGSGPYKFSAYDERPDGFITTYRLTAWDDSAEKPLIGNWNFQFFGNSDDLIKSFNAGGVKGFGNISAADLSAINRPYGLFAWRTSGYYAVFFNQSKNLALQDPTVRQALSVALDRDALIHQIFQLPIDSSAGSGIGAMTDYGPVPPDANYFTPTDVSSSMDTAASLLASDGWVTSASSTFRTKTIQKTSVPLAINLTVPDIDFLVKSADQLQNDWQALGVQVTIATDTPQNLIVNAVKNRNYEALLFGNILGPSSDLYSFWHSSQRFSPGLNLSIYQNKKVDSYIELARQTLGDASRTVEFALAEQAIAAENPAIFLYSPDYLYVTDKSIQGITPGVLSDRWRNWQTHWFQVPAAVRL
jgi:peptide/nickel transport system substrate-binding protein